MDVCCLFDMGFKPKEGLSHMRTERHACGAEFHQALDSFSGGVVALENHGHCDTTKQKLRQDLFAVNKQVPAKEMRLFTYLTKLCWNAKKRQTKLKQS